MGIYLASVSNGNNGAKHAWGQCRQAYVTFKPDLVDEQGTVTDVGTRRFQQSIIDQLAGLAAQPTSTLKA
jgi:hypothetical protein